VHDPEKRLDAGSPDNFCPGESEVNEADLRSFLEAALAHLGGACSTAPK